VIVPKHLFNNILDNLCCIGTQPLREGEWVVSQLQMPGLYGGKLETKDRGYLKEIFDHFEPKNESDQFFDVLKQKDIHLRLEKFYLKVMEKDPSLLESVIHQFIYRFWDKLDTGEAIAFPSNMKVYYKCKGEKGELIEEFLLPKLRKAGCNCDLVGVCKDMCLWLVDVKRDPIDDRAIGQIRRYYEIASEIIASCDININVRLVRPALICPGPDIPVSRFFSLGLPFRDICEIWTYSIDRSKFVLHDNRLQLLSLIRTKKHFE